MKLITLISVINLSVKHVFTTYNNRLRSLLDITFPDVSKNVEAQQEKQKKYYISLKFMKWSMLWILVVQSK